MMSFSNPLYRRTFEIALNCNDTYHHDLELFNTDLNQRVTQFMADETEKQLQEEPEALDSAALINAQERIEKSVKAKASVMAKNELQEFNSGYLMKILCSIDDDEVRQLACSLAADNLPQLSKIHTQFSVILEEQDRLRPIVNHSLHNWKNAILVQRIAELKAMIAKADATQQPEMMKQLQHLYNLRHKLAAIIGDRVVNPK